MTDLTWQYKMLVSSILELGTKQEGRNGNTLVVPHYSFTLNFADPRNSKLLLRKMWYNGVIGEFKTLVDKTPLTNVSQFEDNGCSYWSDWADPMTGALNLDYYNMLHPQLEEVIENIKTNPESRRHVIELWNHDHVESGELSLPCCWHGMTFSIIDRTVHMTWVQRSVDTMIGLPADIYLAYLFMKRVCKETGLEPGTCMFALSNVHIYEEHLKGARELLDRTEYDYNKALKFELIS